MTLAAQEALVDLIGRGLWGDGTFADVRRIHGRRLDVTPAEMDAVEIALTKFAICVRGDTEKGVPR